MPTPIESPLGLLRAARGIPSPSRPAATVVVKVVVTQTCDDEELASDDRSVAGTYEVTVAANLKDHAGAALDAFHNTVPIECLDDFDIEVVGADGLPVERTTDFYTHPIDSFWEVTKVD